MLLNRKNNNNEHKVLLVQSQSCQRGIQRLQAKVLLVLRWVRPNLLQRLDHVLRGRRWRWQMGTLRTESVLIGHVNHLVPNTIGTGVRVSSVGLVRSEALLVGSDSVARFVRPVVVAIVLEDVAVRQDLGGRFRISDGANGRGQGGDEDLVS